MRIRILAFVALSSLGAATSHATLGERFSSSQFQAQITGSTSSYVKHEWESHGTTVNEFSAKSGVVFAVAWRGPRHPDLESLRKAFLELQGRAPSYVLRTSHARHSRSEK